jgi:hypothetical protein
MTNVIVYNIPCEVLEEDIVMAYEEFRRNYTMPRRMRAHKSLQGDCADGVHCGEYFDGCVSYHLLD